MAQGNGSTTGEAMASAIRRLQGFGNHATEEDVAELPQIKSLEIEETWMKEGQLWARGTVTWQDDSQEQHEGPMVPVKKGGQLVGYTLGRVETAPGSPFDLDDAAGDDGDAAGDEKDGSDDKSV